MLSATTTHDPVSGVCEITVRGSLDLHGAGVLRVAVLKGLAVQPMAMLVDLNDAEVIDPLSLLMLPSLDRRAAADHGLRLRCFMADRHPQRGIVGQALGRHMSVSACRADALSAGLADSADSRRVHRRLVADEWAAATARDLVATVCAGWQIADVADDAQIIVSELTSNAVLHAGSDFDLVLVHRAPFLHIQVIDAHPRVPLFPIAVGDLQKPPPPTQIGGWGLYLVHSIASGCGVVTRPPGKLVWATVRTHPINGLPGRRPVPVSPPAP